MLSIITEAEPKKQIFPLRQFILLVKEGRKGGRKRGGDSFFFLNPWIMPKHFKWIFCFKKVHPH